MKRSQGRMIRKSISQSKGIAQLSPESISLFCMLIPHFNAHGKMNGDPYFIKGEVVPRIKWFTVEKIKKCLKEISQKTNVKWFIHDGLWYIHSLNFKEHQELREERLGDDCLPSYPGLLRDYSMSSRNLSDIEVEEEVEDKEEVKEEDKVEEEVKEQDKGKSGVVPKNKIPYQIIVEDLNKKAEKKYKVTESTKALIRARWNEGFREEDFFKVHSNMSTKWKNDPKRNQYLRPVTLYRASKFEGYLNAKIFLSDKKIISEETEIAVQVGQEWLKEKGEIK